MKRLSYFIVLGLILLSVFSCKEPKELEPLKFDRTAMLSNIASNLIVPSFQNCLSKKDTMQAAQLEFSKLQDSAAFIKLRQSWTTAYLSWQSINAYNFGPAGEEGINKSLNDEIAVFPVNTVKIETAVASGTNDFNDFNRDSRGFLAIEYLLFSKNVAESIDLFKDTKRMNFLAALISHSRNKIEKVNSAWKGSYLNEFTANSGTDAGSSTSLLYNEFVKSFEGFKNFKLGLPLGKRPGQIKSQPELVEAYYSGSSLVMAKAHFQTLKNIWYGIGYDSKDGIGFKEYLQSVEGGKELVAATENQLKIIDDKFANIPSDNSLQSLIISNDERLNALYTEIQKHTRFFKSDMSSLLGIAITYSSGDGD